MIRSFRNKGLARSWQTGTVAGITPQLAKRVRQRLDALDRVRDLMSLNTPTYRLHQYKGKQAGRWSIDVNGPWRITFAWRDGDAHEVDLEQPH